MTGNSPARQATSLFQERFGSQHALLVSAPGRVNLLGEHTDYNGGPVLPFAIGHRTAVAAGPGPGWEAVSSRDGVVQRLDPALPAGGWEAYVAGVIRVLQRRRQAPVGARLAVDSSVPVGAGLSSSAALCVALAKALTGLAGRRVSPAVLADIAWEAEHDEVGVACGRMDQTISALARTGHALHFETATGELHHVPLPGRVWILDTGLRHTLTGGHLNERRQQCVEARRLAAEQGYRVAHLAELAPGALPALVRAIPAPFNQRLRHVVTETHRTREASAALAARDLERLGRLLVEGHASLRNDYQSSCAEADLLVDALVQGGALGARLTGAGWGGAVIALLPAAGESRILAGVQERFEAAFGRLPPTWSTRAMAGVRKER